MGTWSQFAACSHPSLAIDTDRMPQQLRELLEQHGEVPEGGGTHTLGALLRSFCDASKIWGYLDAIYTSKWAVTMKYLAQEAARSEEWGAAEPPSLRVASARTVPLWILFVCREHDRAFWFRWEPTEEGTPSEAKASSEAPSKVAKASGRMHIEARSLVGERI